MYITVSGFKRALPDGRCTVILPVGADGKCVLKDCRSMCHQKYKGSGRCGRKNRQTKELNSCQCAFCGNQFTIKLVSYLQ